MRLVLNKTRFPRLTTALTAIAVVFLLLLTSYSMAEDVEEVSVSSLIQGNDWQHTWPSFKIAGIDLTNPSPGYVMFNFTDAPDTVVSYNGKPIGSLDDGVDTSIIVAVGESGTNRLRFQAESGTRVEASWYNGFPIEVPLGGVIIDAHTIQNGSRYDGIFDFETGYVIEYDVSANTNLSYFSLKDDNAYYYGRGETNFRHPSTITDNRNWFYLYSVGYQDYHIEVTVPLEPEENNVYIPEIADDIVIYNDLIGIDVDATEYSSIENDVYLPDKIKVASNVIWGFETEIIPPMNYNLTVYQYDIFIELQNITTVITKGYNPESLGPEWNPNVNPLLLTEWDPLGIEGIYRYIVENETTQTTTHQFEEIVTLDDVHVGTYSKDDDGDGFPKTEFWTKDYTISGDGTIITSTPKQLALPLVYTDGTQTDSDDTDPGIPNAASDLDDDDLGNRIEVLRYGFDPRDNDTDNDSIPDKFDLPAPDVDEDGDGLSNSLEVTLGSNPIIKDTDGDFLDDGAEAQYWWLNGQAPNGDIDGDGIKNIADAYADFPCCGVGTPSPENYYDRDGIQILLLGSNPAVINSDYDGTYYTRVYSTGAIQSEMVSDGNEASWWLSEGYDLTTDSDGDGFYNHQDEDSDDDGILDWSEIGVWGYFFETVSGFKPDGGPNYASDPTTANSDTDGINDYTEIMVYYTNPGNDDSDGDGLDDPLELSLDGSGDADTELTNPIRQDTDGDWLVDGWRDGYRYDGKSETFIYAAEYDDNVIQSWEGEDFNLDGGVDSTETNPKDMDSEDDTLIDGFEALYSPPFDPLDNTDDPNGDYDSDGITEYGEQLNKTSPLTNDTDSDSMDDKWEIDNGTDPLVDDAAADPDGDGLNNTVEYHGWMVTVVRYPDANATTYLARSMPLFADGDSDGQDDPSERANQTDPYRYDTDRDGLWDGYDRNLSGTLYYGELTATTNVTHWNSDSDGLSDGAEVYGWSVSWDSSLHFTSDPNLNDTDNDSLWDGSEYLNQSNPRHNDTDGDQLLDPYEVGGWVVTVYNHSVPSHARPWDWSDFENATESRTNVTSLPYVSDTEGDGLNDYAEWLNGSNPNVADTDGDSISDYDEVVNYGTSAFSDDTDSDYLLDVIELGLWWDEDSLTTTNASNRDTDGDQIPDGLEDENVDGSVNTGVETDPNDNDTDEDGLLDGSEEFTITKEAANRVSLEAGGTNSTSIEGEGWDLTFPELSHITRLDVRFGLADVNNTKIIVSLYLTYTKESPYDTFEYTLFDGELDGENNTLIMTNTLYDAEASSNVLSSTWLQQASEEGWELRVADNSTGNTAKGWIESFVVEYTIATLPLDNDSDGDGLLDGEEVNYGVYGFISNAWRTDTDRDSLSDYAEVVKTSPVDWITDPALADTDDDGFSDDEDINPLGNAFLTFSPEYIEVSHTVGDSDDISGGNASDWDVYFAVKILYVDPILGTQTNGTYHTQVTKLASNSVSNFIGGGVSFDVPDNISSYIIYIEAWELDGQSYGSMIDFDRGGSTGNHPDDRIDIDPNSGSDNIYKTADITYNAITDVIDGDDDDGDITGDSSTSGMRLKYDISITTEPREKMLVLLPKDGSLTFTVTNNTEDTGDDWARFIGQGRYYIFHVNVTEHVTQYLQYGLNTIIIPEGVFYNTRFYSLLNSTGQADVSTNYSFLPDDTAWQAPDASSESAAYVLNIIVLELNASQTEGLIDSLRENETGAWVQELYVSTFQDNSASSTPLAISGIPLAVLDLIPRHQLIYPEQKSTPQDDDPFWLQVVKVIVSGEIFIVMGQAFYAGVKWFAEQIGLGFLWEIDVSWDDIVNAVVGFFNFLFELVKGIINAIVSPLINAVQNAWDGFVDSIYSSVTAMNGSDVVEAAENLVQVTIFSTFALAIFAVVVGFSVAEKIIYPFFPAASGMTAATISSTTGIIGMILGFFAGLIIAMFAVNAIDEWDDSTVAEELIPEKYNEVASWTFSIATLLFIFGLKLRTLQPIKGLEMALAKSLVGFAIISALSYVESKLNENFINEKDGVSYLMVLSAIGLAVAVSGGLNIAEILGPGWNIILYAYPFVAPVSLILSIIAIATSAFTLVGYIGEYSQL